MREGGKIKQQRIRSAFSLFEALLCVVILGVIGFVCSSMLLHISQNIAFVKATNDTSPRLALMQVENLLQSAIPRSLTHDGTTPLNAPSSSLHFARLDEGALGGTALHNAPFEPHAPSQKPIRIDSSTLMPHKSLEIVSSHERRLDFATLWGWEVGDWLAPFYDVSLPNEPFIPYRVESLNAQSLTLHKPLPPSRTPLLALPITLHSLSLRDEILWLDSVPLLHHVASFEVSLISLPHLPPHGLLKFTLCQKRARLPRCAQNIVLLQPQAQILKSPKPTPPQTP